MRRLTARISAALCGALAVALLAPAAQAGDPCRTWRGEHRDWKTKAIERFLSGAPQRELDTAIFEMLQREAYLTSCDVSVEGAKNDLVGWRLVNRAPDDYGSAVLESVLERAGFELDLRAHFANAPAVSTTRTAGARRMGPRRR